MTAPDEQLLARLRLAAADPPPGLVVVSAKAVFGLRALDAELAELVADSLESAGAVRGSSTVRLLAFEVGEVSLDVEVSASDGLRRLVGQLSGAATLLVDTPTSSAPAQVDELGRFVADDVPAGPVRLRMTTPDGVTVATAWTTV